MRSDLDQQQQKEVFSNLNFDPLLNHRQKSEAIMIMGVETPSNKVDYIELSKSVHSIKDLRRSRSIEFRTVYEDEIKIKPQTQPGPTFI